LRKSNLIRGQFVGIKILGDGELKHDLKVEADKISPTAREKIEKAGGTVTVREGRSVGKNQADVASSEGEPEAAVAAAKPRVRKTKSRKKKSE